MYFLITCLLEALIKVRRSIYILIIPRSQRVKTEIGVMAKYPLYHIYDVTC